MKKVFLSRAKNSKLVKSRMDIVRENKGKVTKKLFAFRPQRIRLSKKMKKILLISLGVVFVIGLLGGLRFLAYVQSLNDKLPNPETVFQDLPVASEIYDRLAMDGGEGGTRLYRIFSQYNADNFSISEIPDTVKLAFIAAEDSNFFEHGGFDPQAIFRCGINYIKDSSNPCGASTITQQLVKLTTEIRQNEEASKVQQKIEELLLALKVEQSYPKEQVLLMYLRATPYGSSIVGLKAAANFYFRKQPKDLTIAEAVMLASIIQNPSYLSPTVPYDQDTKASRERLQERMDYVFGQLTTNKDKFNTNIAKYYNDDGKLTTLNQEMIDAAKAEDWQAALKPPVATDMYAGHFVNYVIEELQTRNYKNGTEPFTRQDLQVGGYRIYTTLDYNLQKIAEGAAAKGGNDYTYWNANNAALLTIAPNSGQVLAMAGSKDFFGESTGCDDAGCKFDPEVNVLTSIREPGSSNKPMGYYLAFKEGKLFPGSLLPDFPLKIVDANGNLYDPKNWDGQYKGVHYNAGQALIDSRNIPAIEVVGVVGVQNYIDNAKLFGYTTYTGSYGEAVILGGVSVKPIEHAQAYGVFANGGDLVKLNPIMKILDKEGKTIYEAQPERSAVGDPQAIFVLNETLKQVPGGNNISWDGREFAGKTGTTNNNEDSWFVGYTPDMVTLAWVGNNIKSPMDQNYGYAYYVIGPWYSDYLRAISDFPYFAARSSFPRPGNVFQGGGGCNAQGECQGISGGWMIEGRNPPIDIKKSVVKVCVDQQDRKARQVDIDAGKSMDREFIYYVEPVAAWQNQLNEDFTRRGLSNGPPTAECDANRNGVFINAPTQNTTVGGTLNIVGSAFDTAGSISGINFSLGGIGIPCTAVTLPNYNVNCNIGGFDNGRYTLTANTVGGGYSTSVSILVNGETTDQLRVNVTGGGLCTVAACPRFLQVSPPGGTEAGSITSYTIWQQNPNGSYTSYGGGTTASFNPSGGAGVYGIFAIADVNGGLGTLNTTPSSYFQITVSP